MNRNYIGIIFILLHSFFDVSFYLLCKWLQKDNIYSVSEEVIFVLFYNLKALILLILIFILKNFYTLNIVASLCTLANNLNRYLIIQYLSISIFSAAGFIIFLYGLKDMIIANAMSLKYIEQVFWILVGIIILKEKVIFSQLCGILVSLGGITLIIADNLSIEGKNFFAYYFPLLAAICWTISSSIGKHLMSKNLKILNHMVYYYSFHVLSILIIAIFVFFLEKISFSELNINLSSPEFLVHILSMSCFYIAMRMSPMSLLGPFVYIKLILSCLFGYLVFGEIYNIINIIGYMLIVCGGFKIFISINKQKNGENI